MAFRVTAARANATLDSLVDEMDGGAIVFYTGLPADAVEEPSGGTVDEPPFGVEVARCPLNTPAFSAASEDAGLARATMQTGTPVRDTDATGLDPDAGESVEYFRIEDSDGNDLVQGTVTEVGLGGDIELSSVVIGAGTVVAVTSFAMALPHFALTVTGMGAATLAGPTSTGAGNGAGASITGSGAVTLGGLLASGASTPAADRFVDASGGSDLNDGTSEGSAWATLDHAYENALSGEFVSVLSGSYYLSATTASAAGGYRVFGPAPGASVTLTGVAVIPATPGSAWLELRGFTVAATRTSGRVVTLTDADDIKLTGCEIQNDRHAVSGTGIDGVYLTRCDRVTIADTFVGTVTRGVNIADCADTTIDHCYITPSQGTGIGIRFNNTGTVIKDTRLTEAPYPIDGNEVVGAHASGISIRSSDVTIQRCLIHNIGTTSAIGSYKPDGESTCAGTAYTGIVIENCAIYDTALQAIWLNCLTDVAIRNNLVFAQIRSGPCGVWQTTNDARYRYRTAFTMPEVTASSSINIHNNIFIGQSNLAVDGSIDQSNNYIWSIGGFPSSAPNGTEVYASSYSGCGNHNTVFEDAGSFFVNAIDYSADMTTPLDWSLAPTSPGKNGGNVSEQPSDSLGSVGVDGFLMRNGPARSASAHDAGPYQS